MTAVAIPATVRQEFEELAANGGGEGPAWLAGLRRRGMERFAAVGFPTTRDEEWRFTPVTPIATGVFAPAPDTRVTHPDLAPWRFGHGEWPTLVVVNGRFEPTLSHATGLPAGVRIGGLAAALATDGATVERHLGRHAAVEASPFTALNTAVLRDGVFVHVAANVELAAPIHVIYVAAGAHEAAAHPRSLVVLERGARASLVESYVTLEQATYFTNVVTEVSLAENAWLEHARLQRESDAAFHVGHTEVVQARDSHYRNFALQMGARIARHDLNVRLAGSNTETLMYGLYFGRGEQLVDNHTAIHHDHPNCNSWEVYKGVLDDRSRGVFNGKIYVKPEAQKTDAKQTNRAILLSDHAKIDTKPQLEIFADDVKCTHGATVGRLDEQALFYFKSRGIPAELAQRLMIYAFCAEVVDEVAIEPVRDELNRLVRERVGIRETR